MLTWAPNGTNGNGVSVFSFIGKGVTEGRRKRALLLHCAGTHVQEIFSTLPDTGGETNYDAAVAALDKYFYPFVNKFYERYRFRQLRQDEIELIDQLVSRLRKQAEKCQFADPDENLLDQLIEKCHDSKVRTKLLEEGNELTLAKAMSLARTVESVREEIATNALAASRAADSSVYAVLPRVAPSAPTKPKQPRVCYRCGRPGHFANDSTCPARQATCSKCNFRGHFATQCRTKSKPASTGVSRVNFVTQDQGDDDDGASNSEYVFAVDPKHATTHVTIGGIIDSGASSNILTEEQWHKLQARGIKFQPHTIRKILYPYGATTPLKIVDSFIAVVGTDCQQMKTHSEYSQRDSV